MEDSLETMYRSHYTDEITPDDDGKEVVVAGWVHEVRNIGKIVFILLRDRKGIAQIIGKEGVISDDLIKQMSLPKESVIMVRGTVKKNSESRKGYEIVPKEIINLNPLSAQIPFEVTGKVPAELDVRLDYRYIDLRRIETTAIFNIESQVLASFRGTLLKEGFEEIRTPSLVEAATEGGSDLFPVTYFEKMAYLAQSPQLYKQLAVIGGMDKVMMVVPVFRAEKHNTVYHLNESTQMDAEMGFADHNDAIKLLKKVAKGILAGVAKRNAEDLQKLGVEVKVVSAKEITYKKALSKLNANGLKLQFGDDLNREAEELLCKLMGDLLVVKEYPSAIRAFYSMPNEKNPEICNSYDLLYKGLEVSSGAQRIHLPGVLIESMKKRGLNPSDFEFYLDAFKRGAPPHAGWSIGLERFTMKIANLPNIREAALFPRDRVRLKP